jgi:Icc-related predicted phosphoesterase
MKVCCISDLHNDTSWREYDGVAESSLILIAGDVCDDPSPTILDQMIGHIRTKTFAPIVFIAGNHDQVLWRWRPTFRHRLDVHYLEDSSVTIRGYKIYGSPWTSQVGVGVFQGNNGFRAQKWDMIPEDTDILLTHMPPLHYRDISHQPVFNVNHVGCPHLHQRVLQVKPKLHVFGHIHEGRGMVRDKGITFVNASLRDQNYQLRHQPIFVELPNKKINKNND